MPLKTARPQWPLWVSSSLSVVYHLGDSFRPEPVVGKTISAATTWRPDPVGAEAPNAQGPRFVQRRY